MNTRPGGVAGIRAHCATSCSLLDKSRPDVAGGSGLPSARYNATASSTIWHGSSKTAFSSVPWQPPRISPGALPTYRLSEKDLGNAVHQEFFGSIGCELGGQFLFLKRYSIGPSQTTQRSWRTSQCLSLRCLLERAFHGPNLILPGADLSPCSSRAASSRKASTCARDSACSQLRP